MEMDIKYKPEMVLRRGPKSWQEDPRFKYLYLDTIRGVVAATNLAMLVEIPVTILSRDVSGYIQPEAIERARERAKQLGKTKMFIKAMKTKLVVGDTSFERPPLEMGYPDYRKEVFSKLPSIKDSIIFGVDFGFVERLRESLGVDVNKHSELFFAFDPKGVRNPEGGYEDTIRVFLQTKTKSQEVAVIMPRRWFNNNPNAGDY